MIVLSVELSHLHLSLGSRASSGIAYEICFKVRELLQSWKHLPDLFWVSNYSSEESECIALPLDEGDLEGVFHCIFQTTSNVVELATNCICKAGSSDRISVL